MMGRLDTMKLLIRVGADVHMKNNTGSTPLHAASLNGYGEAMDLLLQKGMTFVNRQKKQFISLQVLMWNRKIYMTIAQLIMPILTVGDIPPYIIVLAQ